MGSRASKRSRIDDSGIAESPAFDDDQENISQITVGSSTRYEINDTQPSILKQLKTFTIEINFLSQKSAMKNPTHEQNALSKEIGCGGSALWNLTGDLRDYHKLFIDRYFNSMALLEKL